MFKVNKELYALREQFRVFYNTNLKTDYKELETHRKNYLRQFYTRIILFSLIGAFLFWLIINNWNTLDDINGGILGLYFFITIWFCSSPFCEYKSDTKRLVMNKILSFFGSFKYGAAQAISASTINASMLFAKFNTRDIDDNFQGTYQGATVTVSEQKLSNISGHGKNRREITIFTGILILLDIPAKSTAQTIVKEKTFKPFYFLFNWSLCLTFFLFASLSVILYIQYHTCGNIAVILLIFLTLSPISLYLFSYKKNKLKKMQSVNLEDVVFDKHWQVRSNDQIEARYVLTPALMERMLEIKRRFYGKAIEFSFWNNKVLIAVHTSKDMFETTSLFTPALSYHKVQEVITQFYSIFSAVDLLNNRNASPKLNKSVTSLYALSSDNHRKDFTDNKSENKQKND